MSDIFGGPPDDEEYDPLGYPTDYGEIQDPHGFFGGDIPDDWWYEERTIGDMFGESFDLTVGEWYGVAMGDRPDILDQMGWEEWDLIYELEYYGYWDSDDWEIWREHYNEQ